LAVSSVARAHCLEVRLTYVIAGESRQFVGRPGARLSFAFSGRMEFDEELCTPLLVELHRRMAQIWQISARRFRDGSGAVDRWISNPQGTEEMKPHDLAKGQKISDPTRIVDSATLGRIYFSSCSIWPHIQWPSLRSSAIGALGWHLV
jgi:hypothetical protein